MPCIYTGYRSDLSPPVSPSRYRKPSKKLIEAEEDNKAVDEVLLNENDEKKPVKSRSKRLSLASPKSSRGQSLASPQSSKGQSIASPVTSKGQSLASPVTSKRQSLACPKSSKRQSLASPKQTKTQSVTPPQPSRGNQKVIVFYY